VAFLNRDFTVKKYNELLDAFKKAFYNFHIKNTNQLINLIQENKLPEQIMINTHPQRWNDNIFYWTRELLAQNVKNQIKKIIVKQTNKSVINNSYIIIT